ncbi:MAG: methionine adenosyltransferase domain-containing protein, partial [Muribaculaceae bacterium]|nr:methionine adenosyltransferase domain-containing protein [Muribaculaceae bacterium]
LVQVSYARGVAQPVNIFVNTYGTARPGITDGEIAEKISKLFDLRPGAIEKSLKLRNPIYRETASYGHMGRQPETVVKRFRSRYDEKPIEREVELFTWEKLDRVEDIKKEFGIA